MARYCYYVDETMVTPDGTIPAVVVEDEAGYAPLGGGVGGRAWYWGDLEAAKRIAADYNKGLGLTDDDVRTIITSSMRAGNLR